MKRFFLVFLLIWQTLAPAGVLDVLSSGSESGRVTMRAHMRDRVALPFGGATGSLKKSHRIRLRSSGKESMLHINYWYRKGTVVILGQREGGGNTKAELLLDPTRPDQVLDLPKTSSKNSPLVLTVSPL